MVKSSALPREAPTLGAAAETLMRSAVYRRLTTPARTQVDAAILQRPPGLRTLEEIFERFDLARRGISPSTFRAYARRLEELARPAAAGQVLAAVFGCLPRGYERRLMTGTQILLLSRVVQALAADHEALPVAELGRLGALLAGLARPMRRAAASKGRLSSGQKADARKNRTVPPSRIAELVRGVYGLNLRVETPDRRPADPQDHPASDQRSGPV